jgi:hypothetical protein
MKKALIILSCLFCLAGCDVKDRAEHDVNGSEIPSYVSEASRDLENTIIAKVIKNIKLECHSLYSNGESAWTIGCFIPDKNPVPFLLYKVEEDVVQTNPPFTYKLTALNGKAKQYSEHKDMRFFKIDTSYNTRADIGSLIADYVNSYPPKEK